MGWPAYLLWFAMIGSAVLPGPALIYTLQIAGIFGTLTMIPVGEVNFLPGSICAGLFAAKVLVKRGNLSRALGLVIDPGQAGIFSAFLLYALLTCLVLPRLFAGQVVVVAISDFGAGVLHPTAGNITQPLYFVLSVTTAICIGVVFSNRRFQAHYLNSILVAGAAIVLSGLVDLVTYRTGHSDWLSPFRTASYSLLAEGEVEGAKRVVGFTSEASAYGALCVGALSGLLFLRPFYGARTRRIVVPAVSLALLAMVVLSTSSTAFAGLGAAALLYGVNMLVRMGSRVPEMREGLALETALLVAGVIGVLATAVADPTLLEPVRTLVDTIVYKKISSSSYVERSMWTSVGLQAFFDTGFLGVGLGSLRTSNWFVSVLASTGLFGGALIFGFIAYLMVRPSARLSGRDRDMQRGVRFSILSTLAMSSLGGTIPDIGVHTASLYGVLLGLHVVPLRTLRPAAIVAAEPAGPGEGWPTSPMPSPAVRLPEGAAST